MTLPILAYGFVLALFLGGMAYWLDRALRTLGRPARWVWAASLGVAVVAPFLVPLLPTRGPAASPATLPLQAVYGIGSTSPLTLPVSGPSLVATLERPLLGVWLGASVLLVALLLWVSVRLWRRARRWPPREVGEETVLLSEGLGPAVLGLLRPRIVLPPWALALTAEKLAMVVIHEAEHRRARDPALVAWGLLAAIVCPLNPAVWWMLRRLRLAVEADCDARVLRRGVPGKRYARFLLDVATRPQPLFSLAPALVEGGNRSLERRLAMMQWNVRKYRMAGALGAMLLSGLFLFLACETPTPPSEPSAEANASPVEAAEAAAPNLPDVIEIPRPPQPLIIVDGVITDHTLADIKAMDVKAIEVIKGTTAAPQFGERAANGVVNVTLRDGAGTGNGGEAVTLSEIAPDDRQSFTVKEVAPDDPQSFTVKEVAPDDPQSFTVKEVAPDEDGSTSDGVEVILKATSTADVLLRGNAAGSTSPPLYIIDGVIVTDPSVVETLDKEQIDHIEVIKGAAAQARWGARAANGVVQITTKKK